MSTSESEYTEASPAKEQIQSFSYEYMIYIIIYCQPFYI